MRLIWFSPICAAFLALLPITSLATAIECDWHDTVDGFLGFDACGLIRKEIGDFRLEGRCQRSDDHKRGISLTPFDPPDVRPMMFRSGGKLFLAPTTFLAEGAESLTKMFLHRLHIGMKPRYTL